MFNAHIMKSKELKHTLKQIGDRFGCDCSFLKEYAFFLQENRRKIIIVNKEILDEKLEDLRVDAMGLYIGTKIANDEIRLSVEGTQLIGPHAMKNVIELNDKEFQLWIRGNPVEKETEIHGFVILKNKTVKHKTEYCGCGKPVRDQKTNKVIIHNYIPKTRYVHGEE